MDVSFGVFAADAAGVGRLGRELAALSVAGNSAFSSLFQGRFAALRRVTKALEAEVRKARASAYNQSDPTAQASDGAWAPRKVTVVVSDGGMCGWCVCVRVCVSK